MVVGRTGLQDWLIQRLTALILGAYTIFFLIYFLSAATHTYFEWLNLFSTSWLRFFSILALLSLIAHAWIGLWTVSTDYLKLPVIRLSVQVLILLSLFVYLFWGIKILWAFKV